MDRRYYFAYGSNMEEKPMRSRCRGAVLVGKARLDGYRFSINSKGYATIVPDRKSAVYGLIWDITKSDELRLDGYEAVDTDLYRKLNKRIFRIDIKNRKLGAGIRALLYISAETKVGRARRRYIEKIVSASKTHKFPKAYINDIEKWQD